MRRNRGVLASVYYNAINPTMGMIAALKSFSSAVFGGLTSSAGSDYRRIFPGDYRKSGRTCDRYRLPRHYRFRHSGRIPALSPARYSGAKSQYLNGVMYEETLEAFTPNGLHGRACVKATLKNTIIRFKFLVLALGIALLGLPFL